MTCEIIKFCILQELAKTQTGNFVLGMLPLQAILALLSCGTKGETRSQVRSLLHLNTSNELVAEEYQQVIKELQRIPNFKVNLSNRLFINDGLKIEPSFFDKATGLSTLVENFH
ncbi:hypothetical protein WA026_005657 [Henosepilachna vigintioctopunctata]|uniref:Serpin domain-containing protein n=1 Tax=Henosepilachna vigintioctopunctata TaxID=420089 RepID=A0AAW1TTE8_9CUCU